MSDFKTCDQLVEHFDENTKHLIDSDTYDLIRITWEAAGAAMCDESKRIKSERDALQAQVSELEHREDAMCDLHYANGAKQGFSWGQVSDDESLHQCVSARMSAGVSELVELRKAGGGDENA